MQDTLLRRYDPETCHTSKRGSRLLLVRLNVGARTDAVWSRVFRAQKAKIF